MQIVRLQPHHRGDWELLYAGYAQFYRSEQTPAMRQQVWSWIHDESAELEAFVAVDENGKAVGLAHFRQFTRPLSATKGGFLDDLFVDPIVRGSSAARSLLLALRDEARRRNWSVIRWITADDNYRARGLYDKVATRTHWITYDMKP